MREVEIESALSRGYQTYEEHQSKLGTLSDPSSRGFFRFAVGFFELEFQCVIVQLAGQLFRSAALDFERESPIYAQG